MQFNQLKRREFITLLGGAAVARPLAARAQQGGKRYTIGYFSAGSPEPLQEVFTNAVWELGWVEAENIALERRYADSNDCPSLRRT